MKTEELMIGDYIQDLAGDLCQVIVINRQIAQVETLTGVHQGDTTRYLHEAEGVPLTPDILEKNGFKKEEHDAIIITLKTYSLDTSNGGIVLFVKPKGGYKAMYGNMHNMSQNELLFGDGNFVCMNCNTVHELQHILKQCGIDKEITLEE